MENGRNLKMKRVVVESPYKGNIKLNEIFGEFCLHECLVVYNESPFASHLLYTRRYVLRDHVPADRKLGINAGFEWRDVSDYTVFYVDLGMTEGMQLGIDDCEEKGRGYSIRRMLDETWEEFLKACEENGLEKPERNIYKK